MKKINAGSAIQVLANVGVLASVLLLVYELNQGRQLAQAEFLADVRNSMQDIDAAMLGSEPAEVWARAIETPSSLTSAEIKVMDAYLFLWVNNWWQQWLLERAGLIESGGTLANMKDIAGIYFANDFAHVWWDIEKGSWGDPVFVGMGDEALAAAGRSATRRRIQQIHDALGPVD